MDGEPIVDLPFELSEDLKRIYAAYAQLHLRPFSVDYRAKQAVVLTEYIANANAAIEEAVEQSPLYQGQNSTEV
jgi:hypothetical protein